jgi:hypothetical protein
MIISFEIRSIASITLHPPVDHGPASACPPRCPSTPLGLEIASAAPFYLNTYLQRNFVEEKQIHAVDQNLPPTVALVSISIGTLNNDFIHNLVQMIG